MRFDENYATLLIPQESVDQAVLEADSGTCFLKCLEFWTPQLGHIFISIRQGIYGKSLQNRNRGFQRIANNTVSVKNLCNAPEGRCLAAFK